MKYKILFLLFFSIYINTSLSQNQPDSNQVLSLNILMNKYSNTFYSHWNEKKGTPDIINFNNPHAFAKNQKNSAENFFAEFSDVLEIKSGVDSLSNSSAYRDDNGIAYFRFNQSYRGIPVVGGEYVVTVLPDNKVQAALGSFNKNINLNLIPSITLNQALQNAIQSPTKNIELKDTLYSSRLVIFPDDGVYHLAWELKIPAIKLPDVWLYYIDALSGKIISSNSLEINDRGYNILSPQAYGNVYLTTPLDGSYINKPFYDIDNSGYLQGTYASVVNDYTGTRAYSSSENFSYTPSDTKFDEANLYYQIDHFRTNYWNSMGFNKFTQIIAHAHTNFSGGPNAQYNGSTQQLYFSDSEGYSGFNSFAQDYQVIYHEYTHAVTHHITDLQPGNTEYGAIDEGNSDYFAGTFTGRTKIGVWACQGWPLLQRDMTNPRIANYSQYEANQYYPNVERHLGGELWSACLWDIRTNINTLVADRDIYNGLPAVFSV